MDVIFVYHSKITGIVCLKERMEEIELRALLYAGEPVKERVVQYGPFVMNTEAEIKQAISDYQNGKFTAKS